KERVNGVEHEDSVAVNCFVGDSLLDFLASRKAMLDAMDSTRPNDAVSDRKEQVVAIIESEPLPGQLDMIRIPTILSNQCTSKFTRDILNPGSGFGKIRAFVHTHPFKVGDVVTCPDTDPNAPPARL
ncbi:MAG TPA: hypothetical protein VHM24_12605, partial [Gemmatimonadaceae bacterium]|nr:hypothetical protein [Gemmatimonadaceae bacterium]